MIAKVLQCKSLSPLLIRFRDSSVPESSRTCIQSSSAPITLVVKSLYLSLDLTTVTINSKTIASNNNNNNNNTNSALNRSDIDRAKRSKSIDRGSIDRGSANCGNNRNKRTKRSATAQPRQQQQATSERLHQANDRQQPNRGNSNEYLN
jgi:hypothetical protein